MGKDLYDNSPAAREIFDAAGEQVKDWCFNGTKEMLRQTYITQPSIYITTMAAYAALREAVDASAKLSGVFSVQGYAGFSLGEYSALTAAGVIRDVARGQYIVQKRGNLMNDAGKDAEGNQRGGMAAAFGNREDILAVVEETRNGRILEAVNFNSPVQTVVAGEYAALDDFINAAKGHRIKAKMLSVSTAFHSPLMIPAAAELKKILLKEELHEPREKVYTNLTGRDIMEGFSSREQSITEYVAEVMASQAMKPVHWQETIEDMIADGVEVIIEVGPGKTLSGIIKKIDRGIRTLNVEDHESLCRTVPALEEMIAEKQAGQSREAGD